MTRYFEGNVATPKGRFAICASRFNSFITEELLKGALGALAAHGGALIRGGTPHFDYISTEVTTRIGSVAFSSECAVTFGVLTCDTVEQAIDRAGAKAGNKGAEAAVACLEMASLNSKISQGLAKGRLRAVEGKKK